MAKKKVATKKVTTKTVAKADAGSVKGGATIMLPRMKWE
jgi:hypothetical protein